MDRVQFREVWEGPINFVEGQYPDGYFAPWPRQHVRITAVASVPFEIMGYSVIPAESRS
jgi:hypothetical protein